MSQADKENQINQLKQKMNNEPNNKQTAMEIGLLYEDINMFDQALKYYQLSVEIDPLYGHAYFCIGDVHMRKHQYQQAIHFFKKDIQVRPQSFFSYVNISFLLFASGQVQMAIQTFWKGVAIFPSYQATFNYFTKHLKNFVDPQNIPVATTFIELLIGHPDTKPQASQLLKQVKVKVQELKK